MKELRKRPWAASLAASVVSLLATLASVPSAALADTCVPDNPIACLIDCRLHKLECVSGCRARKLACLTEVRAEAHACRLGCRIEGGSDEEISACKRECTAKARAKAHDVCKLGKPACVRLCHPESCLEHCGLVDDGSNTTAEGEASPPAEGTSGLEPATDAGDAPVCEPPIDRECLGACGKELRECSTAVYEKAVSCLDGCSELHGWQRLYCVSECVEHARAGATRCRRGFRQCVGECGAVVENGEAPPATE